MNTGIHYYSGESRCRFTVWAPLRERMVLHIIHPEEQKMEMKKQKDGTFILEASEIEPGSKYYFMPDGEKDLADPASHFQPEGTNGPSEIVDHKTYQWNDHSWKGIPFKDLIIYELHIGTFSPGSTFESAIPLLDNLVATGINAVELMPVAQFPGTRNWGYDVLFPYAVQHSYGGPEGLKKFVDACHQKGIAVILDVVYNHLGPGGDFFSEYGPYFTDRYHCPWGDAINLDGEWSDGVRDYFSDNPLHWFTHYHIDALRLDAMHTIFDNGAVSVWQLMHQKIQALQQDLGRHLYMIAESDLNSPRILKHPEYGGYGFDAQWLDDFHHSIYVLLNPKDNIRYKDFGRLEQLAKAYTDGFVHSGEYVEFRKRRYGASSAGISGEKFVAFINNHDQCGNRIGGETLSRLLDFDRLKLAAAAMLLAPYVPMLFMGEEYASNRPFFFFVDYADEEQAKTISKVRKEEFSKVNTPGEMPDPIAEKTFRDCILDHEQRRKGKYRVMHEWYKKLISLRKKNSILKNFNKNNIRTQLIAEDVLIIYRKDDHAFDHIIIFLNFSENIHSHILPDYGFIWCKLLDSTDPLHDGEKCEDLIHTHEPGDEITIPALSALLYGRYK
jgi:maltooligosyltrehalose trehalohydrolase